LLKESYIYRLIHGIFRLTAEYGRHSVFYRRLNSTPQFASVECIEESVAVNLIRRFFNLLFSPLAAAGFRLRMQKRHSLLLNLNLPPAVTESRFIGAIAGIRVETALWPVIFYPVTDFILRQVPALSSLSSSWDELLLLFIFIAWPVQMALRGKISYRYTGLDLPVLIYAGITLFLLFLRSKNISIAIEGARVYLEYMIWFFVGSNLIINRRQFDALVRGMVIAASVVALVGIGQIILGVETPAQWIDQAETAIKTRAFSIVVSPNVLGSFLVIFIPLTLGILMTAQGRLQKIIYSAALAAMLACMVFTYSRGAWLAMGAAVLIFGIAYSPRLLVVLAAGGVAAIKLVPSIGARISYMLSPAYMASSQKAGRLALWQKGLNNFMQDPLFGSGFGTFGGAVAARRIPGSFYIDNFYLKTAVESGLIGLIALLWVLASALRCVYIVYKKITSRQLKIITCAVLAGLAGVVMHNAVENIFEVPMMSTYFWLLTGIFLALPEIEENQKSEIRNQNKTLQNYYRENQESPDPWAPTD